MGNRDGKKVRGRTAAGFWGPGTQRGVPGKKKGKEKMEEPGWGEIRTLPVGQREWSRRGKLERWRETKRRHLEENGM